MCVDLEAEHDDLDGLVAGLNDEDWDTPTPAPGWMIRDQVSHLAYFDELATMAAADPPRFGVHLVHAMADLDALIEEHLDRGRSMSSSQLLDWWRRGRIVMMSALRSLDPKARLPWYGPPMSAVSFATARLMETWAHGQDVADALGVERAPTDRLRHVAHIGVRALPNSYLARGLAVPDVPVRVELTAPGGQIWTWGEEGAADTVTGSALGFALVVTQRRHPDDTDLAADGPVAKQWISIAQAFAGPPGAGRKPRQGAATT